MPIDRQCGLVGSFPFQAGFPALTVESFYDVELSSWTMIVYALGVLIISEALVNIPVRVSTGFFRVSACSVIEIRYGAQTFTRSKRVHFGFCSISPFIYPTVGTCMFILKHPPSRRKARDFDNPYNKIKSEERIFQSIVSFIMFYHQSWTNSGAQNTFVDQIVARWTNRG